MPADTDGDLFLGDAPPRSPLSWAVFLAASWTWCIGMFLPVILLNEFTVWGWVAFLLPNCLGAAAMGWVLRNPESSRRVVAAHGPMLALFSLVTIAFQAYFAAWMLPKLGVGTVGFGAMAIALILAGGAAFRMRQSHGSSLLLAQATYVASIAAFVAAATIAATNKQHPVDLTSHWSSADGGDASQLIFFAPTFIFGFLLCPYLDLTFHRARQSQDSATGSRIAFGAGFCGFFMVMLLFSLLYAGPFNAALNPNWTHSLPRAFVLAVVAHMILQLAYTMAVHLRELVGPAQLTEPANDPATSDTHTPANSSADPKGLAIVLGCMLLAIILGLQADRISHAGMTGGEVAYRMFMGFYGLVFPAYVWLCMLPRSQWSADAVNVPHPRQWLIFAVALAIAGPMFYLGYIQHQAIWLTPGLALVLLARLVPVPSQAN